MKVEVQSSIDTRKKQAREKVEAHFNALALANLHGTLVEIANLLRGTGDEMSILMQEDERQLLLKQVAEAKVPAEIEAAIASIG